MNQVEPKRWYVGNQNLVTRLTHSEVVADASHLVVCLTVPRQAVPCRPVARRRLAMTREITVVFLSKDTPLLACSDSDNQEQNVSYGYCKIGIVCHFKYRFCSKFSLGSLLPLARQILIFICFQNEAHIHGRKS